VAEQKASMLEHTVSDPYLIFIAQKNSCMLTVWFHANVRITCPQSTCGVKTVVEKVIFTTENM